MALPSFSVADFRAALLRLLPTGRIWSREPGSMPYQLAGVWSPTFQRNSARAANLITDAFPSTTTELLTEWEATLGLPDPCAGESPTLVQRRAQVVARLTDSGGASVAYFTAFAAALGYSITITEYAPARAGIMRAGDAVQGEDWAYCWLVSAPGYSPVLFEAGQSCAGDALMTWTNNVLQCEFATRNPAHLILHYGQDGTNMIGDFGEDIE
ncbi:bacteriophage tail protein [Komagataeibacter europaeus NBRC 3261]|uniref:Bacteriophage tail protein n=1 Tax=Komagataeibacter europaeus NBRC 3261 TaxID=1234669 RepID=A0A0D6PW02_KOMEU|nr:putative phage tail protein [Komagataeibacter europaeus]GAN95344.1 bacteriophage tail protein [Komagataeibacter europaeus NBRC 3261]